MKIYIDTETRSEVDLPNRGVKAYVKGKYFKVLMVQYAIDDGPVRVWQVGNGDPMPQDLKAGLETEGRKLVILNSAFDRTVLNRYNTLGFQIKPEDIIDVMVQALAHGFPASLEKLCAVFNLDASHSKDKIGKDCIRLFCIPAKNIDYVGFHTKESRPEMWQAFVDYAIKDVIAMREVHKRLPTFNYPNKEHALWCLDQRINDRGIPVDVELAEAAVVESEAEKKRLQLRVKAKTGDAVTSATQRDKLLKFLSETYQFPIDDLRTATLNDILADPVKYLRDRGVELPDDAEIELPEELKGLLEVRLQASMNSSAKYKKVVGMAVDGRMCNTMQFCGASRTGRDAGRGLQPQNLRRPETWGKLEGLELEEAIEADIAAIKNGTISNKRGNVMRTLGDCVRGVIKAPYGKKLVCADLSNIEGRALVYLANEKWKVDYFRDFDQGKVEFDNYVMAYARSMNINPREVTKHERQIGKVQELGLGYGGGVSAFLQFAAVYRLDLFELSKAVFEVANPYKLGESLKLYSWAKDKGLDAGLDANRWAACNYLKDLWREAHPSTVRFWKDLEDAFKNAVEIEKQIFTVGNLRFYRSGQYLTIALPSGRRLVYLQPKVDETGQCSFVGVDQFTKKFQRIKTYSGKLSENVTSAFARDVLFYRMQDIENEGYDIVLRVHDELVAEVPDTDEYTADRMAELMATPHEWCKTLPLAAKGFETHRYRKE